MSRFLIVALSALFIHFAWPASASPLTETEISGFIASFQDLQDLTESHEAEVTFDEANIADTMNPMTTAVSQLRGQAVYGDFERIVRAHGFETGESWGRVGDRIFLAYVALQMEQEAPGMRAELEQALREIESTPDLTEEQRQMMREMMVGAMAGVEQVMSVPEADLLAVRPFRDEIAEAFGEGD